MRARCSLQRWTSAPLESQSSFLEPGPSSRKILFLFFIFYFCTDHFCFCSGMPKRFTPARQSTAMSWVFHRGRCSQTVRKCLRSFILTTFWHKFLNKKESFIVKVMCLKLNAPSLRSLCLQSTPLWSRVGSRPPTRAKRASFPRTTSRTCERHHDVITPSLCNSELYLKTSEGWGGSAAQPCCRPLLFIVQLWLSLNYCGWGWMICVLYVYVSEASCAQLIIQ